MEKLFDIKSLFLFDPLSIFFLFVILAVCLPSAVYSIGYLNKKYSKGKIIYNWFLLAAFIASMAAVVACGNALIFLIAWEIMSLVSYFFVVFDSGEEKSVKAGMIYLIMTHVGTAFIAAGFLIMYNYTNSFDFQALKNACVLMPPGVKNMVFLFLLAGFGTKAGIVPLHVWLPYAHPQAPSHISSIMSGVMIKTGIYGIIRFIIFTLGVDSVWWGNLVLALAGVSCLAGVVYALMEHDIKKLLAYHSVENIGIILLGVGCSMVFLKLNMNGLAVFSLIAGLYHLINHAVFKALLFLCAGSVYSATGTRDIEKMGGLIKKMPVTAFAFLVGAMAISALPPLNGFVSEWLTLQAFFAGSLTGYMAGERIFFGLCGAVLALTGGLAAACFVKVFGMVFLAMPRSKKVDAAREAPASMMAGMLFLVFLCTALGLGAGIVFKLLGRVAACAANLDINSIKFGMNNLMFLPGPVSSIHLSTPLIALILAGVTAGVYFGFRTGNARRYNTWDCGYYKLEPRNEYTATGFSKPFRIAFNFFLMPYRKIEKLRVSSYYLRSFKYETFTTPVFKKYIYHPLIWGIVRSAKFMRRLQPGSIHLYISYIFITILLLIIFMNKF
ncbi:MAG: proton-conducting transporter membrane subunit [Candidatus Omnitrophota bacterium]|jgi:hydrogenase-4 component B